MLPMFFNLLLPSLEQQHRSLSLLPFSFWTGSVWPKPAPGLELSSLLPKRPPLLADPHLTKPLAINFQKVSTPFSSTIKML